MTRKFITINDLDNVIQCNAIVGMAVYTGDRLVWIKQAVDSILSQSYKDFVLVLVIDGEVKQDTLSFLVEVSHNNANVALIQGMHNLGLSACMNHVIDWSLQFNPIYFFRMDADDISDSERLATQIAYLNTHSHVHVLGTALIEVNEIGLQVGQRKLPLHHGDIIKFLPKRCSINHPTVAIRFEVFSGGWRYREDLRNTQDYFLWADLSAAGFQFANLSLPLLKFRRVNDFYKRRGLEKSFNEFKARFYTMKKLKKYSFGNVFYALAVLFLRLMPSTIVKLAYKVDRYILNKLLKHE